MKSGIAKHTYSKSDSICPAAIFIPIGLPSDFSLNSSTKDFKSSLVLISSNLDGLITSSPISLPRTCAISSVTLFAGKCPPIPGLVPCPILISIASAFFKFSSVTLYLFGTYSNIYLYDASISSGNIPPSPLHSAVLAIQEPLAKAIFASLDKAPNDICEIYTGISISRGRIAFLPITVFNDTSSWSKRGAGFNCAPSINTSSKPITGRVVPIAEISL